MIWNIIAFASMTFLFPGIGAVVADCLLPEIIEKLEGRS